MWIPKPWPDPRYFYGMPTWKQAKRVAWYDLLKLIPDDLILGGKYGPNVSWGELWIRTMLGSELWVMGMDQPARFEGNPWDGGVLDEACDLPDGCFDLHVRPALDTIENDVNRRGWCWIIGKPSRKGPGPRWFRSFCDAAAAANILMVPPLHGPPGTFCRKKSCSRHAKRFL